MDKLGFAYFLGEVIVQLFIKTKGSFKHYRCLVVCLLIRFYTTIIDAPRARPRSSLADTSVSSLAELGPSAQAAKLITKSSIILKERKHFIKR